MDLWRSTGFCRRCLQRFAAGERGDLEATEYERIVTHTGDCPPHVHNPAGAVCWRVEGGGVYEEPPVGPEPGRPGRVTLSRHLITEEPPEDAPGYGASNITVSFVGVVVARACWNGWDGDQYGDGDGYGPMAAFLWRVATHEEAAPVLDAALENPEPPVSIGAVKGPLR